eukprot:Lankesteria_metandrocarpae@DN5273_c0_g1_i2.p2
MNAQLMAVLCRSFRKRDMNISPIHVPARPKYAKLNKHCIADSVTTAMSNALEVALLHNLYSAQIITQLVTKLITTNKYSLKQCSADPHTLNRTMKVPLPTAGLCACRDHWLSTKRLTDRQHHRQILLPMSAEENPEDHSTAQVRARLTYLNEKLEADAADLSEAQKAELQHEATTLSKLLVGVSAPTTLAEACEYVSQMPRVKIDAGVQKYVLIEVEVAGSTHLFVRGNKKAKYHYQCAAETVGELESKGLEPNVQGGGRIRHDTPKKEIEIFGFSYQYGLGKHSAAAGIVEAQFGPSYSVTFGDYGY